MSNNATTILLKTAELLEKYPSLKYASANAKILAEPGQYSAAEFQSCPKPVRRRWAGCCWRRPRRGRNIVAWHDMGRKLDRDIYYNKKTNEVEDEDYEVIGMRMEPDKEHDDYWIKFN